MDTVWYDSPSGRPSPTIGMKIYRKYRNDKLILNKSLVEYTRKKILFAKSKYTSWIKWNSWYSSEPCPYSGQSSDYNIMSSRQGGGTEREDYI